METFLTQDILDDATDTSSNKNKEARGQGIANIISSLFGGMAGCALVGQSVMNNENGGKSRLSTLISGLSLLLMIRRPPRSTPLYSSAASDVYKRQPRFTSILIIHN